MESIIENFCQLRKEKKEIKISLDENRDRQKRYVRIKPIIQIIITKTVFLF